MKLIFEYFSNILREYSSFVNIWQEKMVLYMKTNMRFWSYLVQFFLEWEIFLIKFVDEIKTHILCSVSFLWKSCCLSDNVEKYCRTGQATDNMAHAHCVSVN
jgi:hypothetical protein